jgi:hypothetical protein
MGTAVIDLIAGDTHLLGHDGRRGDIVFRRIEGMLRGRDLVSLRLKRTDDQVEARAIGPDPVCEYNPELAYVGIVPPCEVPLTSDPQAPRGSVSSLLNAAVALQATA